MIQDTTAFRSPNSNRIAALVLANGAMSRTQLCDVTGLTGAAVSRITRDMISAGFLCEGPEVIAAKRAGRREVMLKIAEDYRHVLALTITGNRRTLVLAKASGRIIEEIDLIDVSLTDPVVALQTFSDRARECLAAHGLKPMDVAGVAVSLSITAAGSTELVTSSPLGWQNVNVRDILEQALGLPVVVEARATSILRADLLLNASCSSAFLINVALGVGSSAYLNNNLVAPGVSGFGGVTHLVVPGQEQPCYCGRHGCLEVSGGGHAILSALGRAQPSAKLKNDTLSDILNDASLGDHDAIVSIRMAAQNMAAGIDSVLSLFAPEALILTGIVGRHDVYRMAVVEALHAMGRRIHARMIRVSNIRSSDAAVWLALETFIAQDLIEAIDHSFAKAV
jgi:predicted NBD/HSP70 family sugar kinase